MASFADCKLMPMIVVLPTEGETTNPEGIPSVPTVSKFRYLVG